MFPCKAKLQVFEAQQNQKKTQIKSLQQKQKKFLDFVKGKTNILFSNFCGEPCTKKRYIYPNKIICVWNVSKESLDIFGNSGNLFQLKY